MPELYVYAELLLHIRQLTLYASLSEDKDKGTQVHISSDKKIITATYGDESASIYLPTQIKGTANVTFPLGKRTEFSTKLQIDDEIELQQAIESSSDVQVPWTASGLNAGVEVACKDCGAVVVESGVVRQWKDLPSENWAELMDLWFCHKPHEHDHGDADQTAAEAKGFSAQSKVMNESGTGLVDILSLLIHVDDSKAVHSEGECKHLLCPSCKAFLGTPNTSEESHRLFKSRLRIEEKSFDAGIFTGAQLLQLIEHNISRRVVVHANPSLAPTQPDSGSLDDSAGNNKVAADLTDGGGDPTNSSNLKERHPDVTENGPSQAADSITADDSHSSSTKETESKADTTTDHDQSNSANSNGKHSAPVPPPAGLLLWIFNPDIYYSSSRRCTPDPSVHRALKIFYQPLSDPSTLLDSHNTTLEELALPEPEYNALHKTLLESKAYLPTSAREFQDWKVGLLDRWEENETGLGAMNQNALNHEVGDMEVFKEVKLPEGWASLYE